MVQDSTLKKLIYVATHRGTKENDLLLTPFVTTEIASLSSEELFVFEKFLQERDDDIYGWLMGYTLVPDEYLELCGRIMDAKRPLCKGDEN